MAKVQYPSREWCGSHVCMTFYSGIFLDVLPTSCHSIPLSTTKHCFAGRHLKEWQERYNCWWKPDHHMQIVRSFLPSNSPITLASVRMGTPSLDTKAQRAKINSAWTSSLAEISTHSSPNIGINLSVSVSNPCCRAHHFHLCCYWLPKILPLKSTF